MYHNDITRIHTINTKSFAFIVYACLN